MIIRFTMLLPNQQANFKVVLENICFLIVHVYPLFTRKRNVSLSFGRDDRTRLGVAISEVPLELSSLFVDFWSSFSVYELLISPFFGLQLDRATTRSRLFGPATCLPHKDGGIPLSVLLKNTTSKLAGLFSTPSFLS